MNPVPHLDGGAWRSFALITAGAIGLFVIVRALPTGTNLSHMDFRVSGGNSIEFCDPANPQFLPVVAVRSPVVMAVTAAAPPEAGSEVAASLTLTTASGKPIGPADLIVVQTRPIHLLICDPSLEDYQHVHPDPAGGGGRWTFRFRPRFGGVYRIFADFTPLATGRGLYASADLEVRGPAAAGSAASRPPSWVYEDSGYTFSLRPSQRPIRTGVPADLAFTVTRRDGGPVPLEPVMDAYAHLVAFDSARSGFAHIHPVPPGTALPGTPPDPFKPEFAFKVMIPAAGRYVFWAQTHIGGREIYAPFPFDVAP